MPRIRRRFLLDPAEFGVYHCIIIDPAKLAEIRKRLSRDVVCRVPATAG